MTNILIHLIFLLAMILQGYGQTKDTIPFVLGDNNAIYFTGSINGSAPLKLMLAPNTDHSVLYKAGEMKGAKLIARDSAITDHPERPLSYGNTLSFADISLLNESIVYNNEFPTEADGIVGKSMIDGKTVELNYDKNIMVLHSEAFAPGENYKSVPIRRRGSIPFVEVTLASRKESVTGWFEFDPGSAGSFSVGEKFSEENHLPGLFESFGVKRIATTGKETIVADIIKIPRVGIASFAAENVTADLYTEGGENRGALGNDFLKRFNLVIDYKNNLLWLRPNHLIQVPYALEKQRRHRDDLFLPFPQIAIFLAVFSVLAFILIALMNRRKSNA